MERFLVAPARCISKAVLLVNDALINNKHSLLDDLYTVVASTYPLPHKKKIGT